MFAIEQSTKEALSESLLLYYSALKNGELQKLSSIMRRESYLITLEMLGFSRAFKDERFKMLLKKMEDDEESLQRVESILSKDLACANRNEKVEIVSFESKGLDRITLHYSENGHPKKQYYALLDTVWKIDYKAGRMR